MRSVWYHLKESREEQPPLRTRFFGSAIPDCRIEHYRAFYQSWDEFLADFETFDPGYRVDLYDVHLNITWRTGIEIDCVFEARFPTNAFHSRWYLTALREKGMRFAVAAMNMSNPLAMLRDLDAGHAVLGRGENFPAWYVYALNMARRIGRVGKVHLHPLHGIDDHAPFEVPRTYRPATPVGCADFELDDGTTYRVQMATPDGVGLSHGREGQNPSEG